MTGNGSVTRWLTLVGTTLQTSLPPLRPRRSISHPWLNDRTIALVDAKRTAEVTPLEKEATLACSAGLAAAYHDYTARTAQKIALYQALFQVVVVKRPRKL